MSAASANSSVDTAASNEALLEECLERTIKAFRAAEVASVDECKRVRERFAQALEAGQPRDVIEILARTQGTDEEHMGIEVARISHAVADVISPSPPLIPFAGKLMAPSAFYEHYTQLHELARALVTPVIYAEDTDAIGVGGLNPIAALLMSDAVLKGVNRRFAIRPFTTTVRLDYESWTFLGRKHFGL